MGRRTLTKAVSCREDRHLPGGAQAGWAAWGVAEVPAGRGGKGFFLDSGAPFKSELKRVPVLHVHYFRHLGEVLPCYVCLLLQFSFEGSRKSL